MVKEGENFWRLELFFACENCLLSVTRFRALRIRKELKGRDVSKDT